MQTLDTATKQLGTSLTQRIGNTPLVRLDRITAAVGIGPAAHPGIHLLGKAEWMNPGGSVKDRAGWSMVSDAIARGEILDPARPDRRLLDATSGNTGIAYSMLGAALGFKVTLCMPSNISPERKVLLAAYGADVIWTDPTESSDGAIRKARQVAAENPDLYYYCDQYSNNENWRAHYRTTGNEIWQQTEGRITHFIASLGTSGTFMGTTRRLRELNPNIQCISMQPDSPFHGLEGLKHMATAIKPAIYDEHLANRNIDQSTEEAYHISKQLGRVEGILVGISAAGATAAALRIAKEEAAAGRDAVIVTILCDSADKYLSERYWTEDV